MIYRQRDSSSPFREVCRLFCVLAIGALMNSLIYSSPEEPDKPFFSIPEGKAHETLKLVAQQGKVNLMAMRSVTRGVSTRALSGRYQVEEAFRLLLEGTPLEVKAGRHPGSFTVVKRPLQSSVSGQQNGSKQTETEEMTDLRTLIGKLVASATMAAIAAGNTLAQSEGEGDDIYTLDPFKVEGSDQGVLVDQSISATRFATDLNELPFAVNVLTEQLIEDLQVSDVKDLVQFAGNVITGEGAQGFGTTTNNGVRLRGFPATKHLINGFAVSTDFAIAPNSLERVEVVKGPASLLYGSIPPGGVINFMSRRPEARFGGKVRLQLGSWDYRRVDFDVTGPLTENIRYLVNVSQEDRDFFWVGQTREGTHINPVLEFDFFEKKSNVVIDYFHSRVDEAGVNPATPRTQFTRTFEDGRLAHELDPDYPVKDFNARDRHAPQWKETDSWFVKYRHSFNNIYTFRGAFRYQDTNTERINQARGGIPIFKFGDRPNPQPGDPDYGILTGARYDRQGTWDERTNVQLNLLADYRFEWGSIKVMPGFDYNEANGWFWRMRAGVVGEDGRRAGNFISSSKDVFDRNTWVFSAPSLDQYVVDDPSTPEFEGPGLLRNNSGNDGSSEEFYVYGSMDLFDERLILTAGFRDSSFDNDELQTDSVAVPAEQEMFVADSLSGSDSIYQAGIVYKLVPQKLHAYGNFAQSFEPQLRTIMLPDADGNPFDVDTDGDGVLDAPLLNDNPTAPADNLFGEGWEVGLKGALADGKLDYTVAYFTTTNNNIIRNVAVDNTPASFSIWYPNLDPDLAAALPIDTRIDEFNVQSGEEEASGLELEITAEPVEGWNIRFTYTNLDTELVADPSSPEAVGRTLPNSPEHSATLYTRYAFSGGLEGLYVGGTAEYMSERISSPPQVGNAGLFSGDRNLYSVFGGYRWKPEGEDNLSYSLQLKINNLSDEFAAEGHWLGRQVPPRNYVLSGTAHF